MSASTGPHGGRAAVYRKPLGSDGALERCHGGLPEWFTDNVDTHWLCARDEHVVLGSPDGSVFLSSDAGHSWEPVAAGLDGINYVALTP